ncbi:hypothetical protein ACNKHR_12115 [Shigella flexneri]
MADLIFYVGAIFVIVTIFPWNEIGSNGSPFVPDFCQIGSPQRRALSTLPGADGCALGCNSGMYSCGRTLYALAKNRQLRRQWRKFPVTRTGCGCGSIYCYSANGSCLNYIIPNPQRVLSTSTVPACFRGWCDGL